MAAPIHKYPSPDLTVFVDPSWLIPSEKYLISHALETVLANLSNEFQTQRQIDNFVDNFNGLYPITEYEIQQFCTRLRLNTRQARLTQSVEFVSLFNTVANRATNHMQEMIDCLHKSFEFHSSEFDAEKHSENLCAAMEYAVNNIRRGQSIIMITGSPAKAECQRLVEMAAMRRVKIHILFTTDGRYHQHNVEFYKQATQRLNSQFFELRRSLITEIQLERIFRSIIQPETLTPYWRNQADNPINRRLRN